MTRALVLLSGGQDSTTCLWWAIARYGVGNVETLTIAYGQRHRAEVDAALKIAELAGIGLFDQHLVELPPYVMAAAGSALVTLPGSPSVAIQASGGLPDTEVQAGLPTTFVPGRNLVFLSIAATYAAAIAARMSETVHVITGVCQTDYSGYPDCREAFLSAMERAINEAMPSSLHLEVVAPLLFKTKRETVVMASQLGEELKERAKVERSLALSVTCYHGKNPGCGECPACLLRAKGFREVEEVDPQLLHLGNGEKLPPRGPQDEHAAAALYVPEPDRLGAVDFMVGEKTIEVAFSETGVSMTACEESPPCEDLARQPMRACGMTLREAAEALDRYAVMRDLDPPMFDSLKFQADWPWMGKTQAPTGIGTSPVSVDTFKLAKQMFDAYGEEACWKTWDGKAMPQWDEVGHVVRARWEAAAKAAVAHLA
jgi:7-cyano-7-deazaguanine synthase